MTPLSLSSPSLSYINPTHLFFISQEKNLVSQHNFHISNLYHHSLLESLPCQNKNRPKMGSPKLTVICFLTLAIIAFDIIPTKTTALMPYTRTPLWDLLLPPDDPFRVLEQTPLPLPRGGGEPLALARSDWKETPTEHVITLDVPGLRKEDVKIEVDDENMVLRISGERKMEAEEKGDKWHRAERVIGKFWREFRLPRNADLEGIKARLENGVLRITVPKLAEEKKRGPKVVGIDEVEDGSANDEIRAANKAEM